MTSGFLRFAVDVFAGGVGFLTRTDKWSYLYDLLSLFASS